jgi:hypothetical protein
MVDHRSLLQDPPAYRYLVSPPETASTLAMLTYSELSRTLNMSNEEGEKWIVNLIRDSRMGVDAKIDLASVCPFYPLYNSITDDPEHATYLQTTCYTDSYADRDNTRSSIPITSHQLRNAECRW